MEVEDITCSVLRSLSPSPETANDGNSIEKEEASSLDPIRLPRPPQHTLDMKKTSHHREEI